MAGWTAAAFLLVLAPPAAAVETEFDGTFTLRGSHGYTLYGYAYQQRIDGKGWVSLYAGRDREGASYFAPARVTATAVFADLGSLGTIDVAIRPSGEKGTVRARCGGPSITYEPSTYEGTIEFDGEEGFTHVSAERASLRLEPLLNSICVGGGSSEVSGDDPRLTGARLRAISYAHGRRLFLQVNENRPGALVRFETSVGERRDGILIYRWLEGSAPTGTFRFDPLLRTASLSLPSPFSGSAALSYGRDSLGAIWNGSFAVDFPGRADVSLAGPGVHASLVHARLTRDRRGPRVRGRPWL